MADWRRRAAGNFQSDGAHLFVDEAVGGENDGAAELIRIARKIRDFAPGFFDEKDAGGGVPFLKTKFPEAVETTGGDAGKIECRGAIAAHAVRALGEFAVVLKVGAGFAVAHGKAGAKQTRRKRSDSRDAHFFPV